LQFFARMIAMCGMSSEIKGLNDFDLSQPHWAQYLILIRELWGVTVLE